MSGTCTHILLMGPRRGKPCDKRANYGDGLYCLDHFRMRERASEERKKYIEDREKSVKFSAEMREKRHRKKSHLPKALPLEARAAGELEGELEGYPDPALDARTQILDLEGRLARMSLMASKLQKERKNRSEERVRIYREIEEGMMAERMHNILKILRGKDRKTESADLACSICQENEKCILFRPCNHLSCCVSCTKRLFEDGLNCPMCRAVPTDIIQIYMS